MYLEERDVIFGLVGVVSWGAPTIAPIGKRGLSDFPLHLLVPCNLRLEADAAQTAEFHRFVFANPEMTERMGRVTLERWTERDAQISARTTASTGQFGEEAARTHFACVA